MKTQKRYARILSAAFLTLTIIMLQTNIASAYISDGANAINVVGMVNTELGNPYYNSSTEDNGEGSPNQRGLNRPTGVVIDPTDHRLFVSDRQNNRIMVYNLNSSNVLIDYTADNVLGQANFTTTTAATTQSGMQGPFQLAYDDTNNYLFVADYNNSRILIYDVTTITNGENAVYVLGQSGFTSSTAATTISGLSSPLGVAYDSTNLRLFVSDTGNNRIVVYDLTTISNGEDAVKVLGQSSFTTATAATTASGLSGPRQLGYKGGSQQYLGVGDATNNRVLIYNVTAITNGEDAVNVLGQSGFTTSTAATTAGGLSGPDGVFLDSNDRMFVSDSTNNRILVYNISSITDGENAVNVLGQSSFTVSSSGTTQSKLSGPAGIYYESTTDDLYVGDFANNRVMVFDGEVDPGVSTPEFSTITMLATLLIGLYFIHRMRLNSAYAPII